MNINAGLENQGLIRRLEHSVEQETVFHAYLIEGGKQVDKKAFAKAFAKGILCPRKLGENCGECAVCGKIDHDNHEDLIFLTKTKTTIPVETIRRTLSRIALQPVNTRNILIIEDADSLNEAGQNTLLKTLEEPPGRTVILLLSENSENLLPTIRSRCVLCRIEGEGGERGSELKETADRIVEMVLRGAPYYRLKKEAEGMLGDSEEALALIEALESGFSRRLLSPDQGEIPMPADECGSRIEALEEAAGKIRKGMAHRYVIRSLLLTIGG